MRFDSPSDPSSRNFGYGRRMDHAGQRALREHIQHFDTVSRYSTGWNVFAQWCADAEAIKDARLITVPVLRRYIEHLRWRLIAGELTISSAQTGMSYIHRVLECLRGDRQVRVPDLPKALGAAHRGVRTSPPLGLDRTALRPIVTALQASGFVRAAAIVWLARDGGMLLREAALADLPRLQYEAERQGVVLLQEGRGAVPKNAPTRCIPVTPDLRAALAVADAASPRRSRNLLHPGERFVDFIHLEADPSRRLLKRHGLRNFRELRAAYVCQRYETLSGHPAPVLGGLLHHLDADLDRRVRQLISRELGLSSHYTTATYLGSGA